MIFCQFWHTLAVLANHQNHQNVSKISPICHQNITKMSAMCHKNIFNISPKYHQDVSKISPEYNQHFTKISPICHQNITNISPICHQNINKMSAKCHQYVTNVFAFLCCDMFSQFYAIIWWILSPQMFMQFCDVLEIFLQSYAISCRNYVYALLCWIFSYKFTHPFYWILLQRTLEALWKFIHLHPLWRILHSGCKQSLQQ